MGRPTLSNARYRVRQRSQVPRYRSWLAEQKSRAAVREMRHLFEIPRTPIEAINEMLAKHRADIETTTGVTAHVIYGTDPAYWVKRRTELQSQLNRVRASMVDAMTSTGRVHVGRWTLRWWALRRWATRLWSRRHVD